MANPIPIKNIVLFFVVLVAIGFSQVTGARYLIITHDNFYDAIIPYAQWKHKMGFKTKIVRVPSELAQNSTSIRNYIVNAYNNWQIKPEFILFVGAPNYIPWSMTSPYSDNYYTDMTGTLENEILSGRLTVHSLTEAQTVVNKMLLYERYPDTTTNWFVKSCLIVREDYEQYSDSIYWSDIKHAKSLMLMNGYETIDTLSRAAGNNSNDVIARVNQGRAFVLYRGQGVGNWWSPFDVNPDNSQNNKMLPVVLSITCQTIGTGSTPATAERWLLSGTPTSPRGAAGYFATTTIVSHQAYLRSALCKGFFNALFTEKKQKFGEACEAGRLSVLRAYGSTSEYRGFITLGDPAMQLWITKPRVIDVTYDTILYANVEETLHVTVKYQGVPVESALVCVLMDTLLYQTGYTNENGLVEFAFNSPPGTMNLTVTGKNLYPHEGTIQIISGSVFLTYISNSINDSLGNNNGTINAGETILLSAKIGNTGGMPAANVIAKLRTADSTLFFTDSISIYGDIAPGMEKNGLNSFVFTVSPYATTHSAIINILITDAQADTFTGNFSLSVTGENHGVTGPDPYGYYIYDDTDTLSGNAPLYDWFEIAPPGPGIIVSEITDKDADTVTYPLPFSFPYYGITYSSIGLCSNGFLELGNATYRFGENTAIPTPGGPKRLIAPFWDDLDPRPEPTGYGEIYYYDDTTNHRWIVEFKDCCHYGNTSLRETFQIVLLDPQYYPTPTGDGEILFLYNTVANSSENTIGIEDETETRGLQYLYNNNYDPAAQPLTDCRALLITTKPPFIQHSPWINLVGYVINDSAGGNNNGIPEPNETLQIVLYIKNDGDTICTGVNGILRVANQSVAVTDSVADFGDIDIGGISDNNSNPYVIHTAEEPIDTIVGIAVYLTGNDGNFQSYAYFTLHIHDETNIKEVHNQIIKNFNMQVYPNPFQNHLVIKFQIPQGVISNQYPVASIKIYDATGRLVTSFSDIQCKTDNSVYSVTWSGTDDLGRKVPAGVYFVQFEAGSLRQIQKAVFLK